MIERPRFDRQSLHFSLDHGGVDACARVLFAGNRVREIRAQAVLERTTCAQAVRIDEPAQMKRSRCLAHDPEKIAAVRLDARQRGTKIDPPEL